MLRENGDFKFLCVFSSYGHSILSVLDQGFMLSNLLHWHAICKHVPQSDMVVASKSTEWFDKGTLWPLAASMRSADCVCVLFHFDD